MDEEDFLGEQEVVAVEEVLDPTNPEDAFGIVSRRYHKLIVDLEDAPHLEEIEKLFTYLCQIHDEASSIKTEKATLANELSEIQQSLSETQTISKLQSEQIEQLEAEVLKSHQRLDDAHAREQNGAEVIENLRQSVGELRNEIEYRAKLAEKPLMFSTSTRGITQRDKDALNKQITKLSDQLQNAQTYQEDLEREKITLVAKIEELKDHVDVSEIINLKQQRRDEILQQKFSDLNTRVSESNSETIKLQTKMFLDRQSMEKVEDDLCNQKQLTNELDKHLSEMQKQNSTNEAEKRTLKDKIRLYQMRNVALKEETRSANRTKKDLEAEMNKYRNSIEAVNRQSFRKTDENQKLISYRDFLRDRVKVLEDETNKQRNQIIVDKNTIDQFQKKCNNSERLLHQEEMKSKTKKAELEMQKQISETLKTTLASYTREMKRKVTEMRKLQGDRKRQQDIIEGMQNQIKNGEEKCKFHLTQMADLHKTLETSEKQLLQQSNTVTLSLKEIYKEKKMLKSVNNVKEHLQEELTLGELIREQLKQHTDANEAEMIRKDQELKTIGDERDRIKLKYQMVIRRITELEGHVQGLRMTEQRLQNTIKDANRTMCNERIMMDGLQTNYGRISEKLMERNQQVEVMGQRCEVLEMTLRRGHTEYDQRLDDIALLKIEVKRLRQVEMQLRKRVQTLKEAKMEVFHLERDLTRERIKCKALEEAFGNPLNLHRWRKLEGSDPDKLVLLRKTSFLQRRLMQQTTLLVERDVQLNAVQELYGSTKRTIANKLLPSMKYAAHARQQLLQSSNQTKALVMELQMLDIQNQQKHIMMTRCRKQLHALRRRFAIARSKKLREEKILRAFVDKSATIETSKVKYAGGGYRMAVTVKELNN